MSWRSLGRRWRRITTSRLVCKGGVEWEGVFRRAPQPLTWRGCARVAGAELAGWVDVQEGRRRLQTQWPARPLALAGPGSLLLCLWHRCTWTTCRSGGSSARWRRWGRRRSTASSPTSTLTSSSTPTASSRSTSPQVHACSACVVGQASEWGRAAQRQLAGKGSRPQ